MYSLDQEYDHFIERVKAIEDLESLDQNQEQKIQNSLSNANSIIIDKEMFGTISSKMNE